VSLPEVIIPISGGSFMFTDFGCHLAFLEIKAWSPEAVNIRSMHCSVEELACAVAQAASRWILTADTPSSFTADEWSSATPLLMR
jgi:hypothetical protein